MMAKRELPQHTHIINGDCGYLNVGDGPVYGNAVAFATHASAVATDWNKITGYKRIETAVTPQVPGFESWGNTDSSGVKPYYFRHDHYLRAQDTESASSLPPYYALIYLMRVH